MSKDARKDLKEALEIMKELAEDRSVPKNIRAAISDAIAKVSKRKPSAVDCSMAIYILDDISNDINMPSHARTSIWSAISKLESFKEKIKEAD